MRAVIEQILDLARWAPSGDNTQPWRFEIRSDCEILIHGYDTRDHCVYDLDGWASQLSHGALLETLAIAATHLGYRARASIASEDQDGHVAYRVVLESDPAVATDPLVAAIRERVVQRRPMRPAPLMPDQRRALERAVEPCSVVWLDSWRVRWKMAALNARNAHIRLTIPEAFAVHKAVIAWDCTTSEDRLPAASLGADPVLLRVMRWAMSSWERAHFLNRFCGRYGSAPTCHGFRAWNPLQCPLRPDRAERATERRRPRCCRAGGAALLAHGNEIEPADAAFIYASCLRTLRA